MAHKKTNLPEKICLQCQRPFVWRKKWLRCWEEVKYCSERCKGEAKRFTKAERKSAAGSNKPPANACAAGQVEDEF